MIKWIYKVTDDIVDLIYHNTLSNNTYHLQALEFYKNKDKTRLLNLLRLINHIKIESDTELKDVISYWSSVKNVEGPRKTLDNLFTGNGTNFDWIISSEYFGSLIEAMTEP